MGAGWFLDLGQTFFGRSADKIAQLEGEGLGGAPSSLQCIFRERTAARCRIDAMRALTDVTLYFKTGCKASILPCRSVRYPKGCKVGDDIVDFYTHDGSLFVQSLKDIAAQTEQKECEGDVVDNEGKTRKEKVMEREQAHAKEAGVKENWRLSFRATQSANPSDMAPMFTEEAVAKDPKSILQLSGVTLVFEASDLQDTVYVGSWGAQGTENWKEQEIPTNSVTVKFQTDGDGMDFPVRRWGVFAVFVNPESSSPTQEVVDALAESIAAVSARAAGLDEGKISIERGDWSEERLRALCAKHGWEFEWMTEEGERQRRLGVRVGSAVTSGTKQPPTNLRKTVAGREKPDGYQRVC